MIESYGQNKIRAHARANILTRECSRDPYVVILLNGEYCVAAKRLVDKSNETRINTLKIIEDEAR